MNRADRENKRAAHVNLLGAACLVGITAGFLMLTASADAAIAPDSTGGSTGGGSFLSFSHTIGAGPNRLLVVSVAIDASLPNSDVSVMTYNGVSMTEAIENWEPPTGSVTSTEIWYMLDSDLPVTGSYTIAITASGNTSEIRAGSISVFGAAQRPPEATAFADDNTAAGAISQTINTLTNGAWIFDCVASDQTTTFTPDPGQNEFFDAGIVHGAAGSYEEKTRAGAESQGWTVDGASLQMSYVLAAFAPAQVYYSVGVSWPGNLENPAANIQITNGLATLDQAQTGDIGVGDEIEYAGGTFAYIQAVVSSSEFILQTATGAKPPDTALIPVDAIRRAFGTIPDAITNSGDGTHLGSFDLTASGVNLTWICYDDGPFDAPATISGYTTDPTHYITLTVADDSQVATGNTQRHDGTAGNGARVVAVGSGGPMLSVSNDFVTVEWLEIDGTGFDRGYGIRASGPLSDITFRNLLVHDISRSLSPVRGIGINQIDQAFVYNNFVYDILSTDAGGTGRAHGIADETAGAFNTVIHNNTVFNVRNIQATATANAYGIVGPDSADRSVMNNIVIDAYTLGVGNAQAYCAYNTGALNASTEVCHTGAIAPANAIYQHNMSSDDTGVDNPPGATSITFEDAGEFQSTLDGSENLHLSVGADAIDAGFDASTFFGHDIDGEFRLAPWDMGADETVVTAAPLYRSVGINNADLNTNFRTVEIAGGTATFSGPMPNDVGVGDVLQYNDGSFRLAFIHGRSSSTVYTVRGASGGIPQPTGPGTFVEVFRAYTSLSDWGTQFENTNIDIAVRDFDNSFDLVANDTIMNATCYGDGADTKNVLLSGWITGPTNLIRIYTPTDTSEVGASQRHNGTWDVNAYRLEIPGITALEVHDNYVRIDGLQVHMTTDTNGALGITFRSSIGASDYEVSNSIVRGNGFGFQDIRIGLEIFSAGFGELRANNNLFYDWDASGLTFVAGISPDDVDFTVYLHNNTVVDCQDGINVVNGTTVAKNNLVYNNVDNYVGLFDAASTNNLSGPGSDLDIPPNNARDGFAVTFVNAAADDFHLDPSDTGAQDFGTNLAGDPDLAFVDDIDGGLRVAPWDIGADDALAGPSGPMRVLSGSYIGDGLDDFFVYVGFQPDVVVVKEDTTGEWSVMRTSTMIGDASKELASAAVPLFPGGIKSLDPSGFTLGTDPKVNASGATHYWIALKAGAGEMKVGSYPGDGNDDRSIPGVGFQPDYVITMSAGADMSVHRSSSMPGDTSYNFNQTELGPPANAIQAFEPDGFQVGNDPSVNGGGRNYHYVAWKQTASRMAVGTYVGDGSGSQVLDIVGFEPQWLLVKQEGDAERWTMKPASTGRLVDHSLFVSAQPGLTDLIRALRPLGFEVGSLPEVNNSGSTYHWIAFAGGSDSGQVHYRWRNDDADEVNATWAASEDTKLIGLAKNDVRRLRFQVANNTGLATGATAYQIQFAETATCAAGAYTAVPNAIGDHWRVLDSGNIADGEATTNVVPGLSDEAPNFIDGEVRDLTNTTNTIVLNNDDFTEIEFVLEATALATDGGDYCFRLYDTVGAAPLPFYPAYAKVRILGSATSLTLADHGAGQVPDQFSNSTPVTSELFAFNLSRLGGVTVDNIRVQFSTGTGLVDSDVTNANLYRDANNDGIVNGGDIAIATGVNGSGGRLAFNGLGEDPGVLGTNYLVEATVSNLMLGDTTTLSLGLADIDVVEGGVTEAGAVSNAIHTQDNSSCPQSFNYLNNPIDVTPATAGSWQDVDVSLYVPIGATGVIVQFVADTSDWNYGIRMNGSTDTFGLRTAHGDSHGFVMAGLDASRVFEVYTESTAVTTYLIGYTTGGVTFFQNAPQKSLSLTTSWEDVDISADTGVDTAMGAIFAVVNTSGSSREFGLRMKDSTDSRTIETRPDAAALGLIGVDSNEFAQFYRELASVELYLTGYVTSGAVFFMNAVDKSTTTLGAYEDVDITADIGADNANGAILEVASANNNNRRTALRRNGVLYDYYNDMRHSWALTAVDGANFFEQKIEATDADLFLTGYTLACVTPATNYRSIGTAQPYGTGQTDGSGSTVSAINSSPVVTGSLTSWRTFNRGRGDHIDIEGTEYTIFSVDSETQLTLTEPFTGGTGSGKTYTISRQYSTLQAWEDCISFDTPTSCSFFQVASADLVADDRREIGIAYNDTVFTDALLIDGSTTDLAHDIKLTVNPGNRHYGIPGAGVVLDNSSNSVDAVALRDDFVTVEWLEVFGGGPSVDGVHIQNQVGPNHVVVRNMLIHNMSQNGISTTNNDLVIDIYNNILYDNLGGISIGGTFNPGARVRVLNNTVYNSALDGISSTGGGSPVVLLQNNISHTSGGDDYDVLNLDTNSSNNLSSDTSGIPHSPNGGGINSLQAPALMFVNPAANDLHILPGSDAENTGTDLTPLLTADIDAGSRTSPWDIGADDIAATTAVELLSFTASGGDAAVELRWETGSEVDNVGFYLYRATSEAGPFEPLNPSMVPGLGSSPLGASYRYVDSGLVNGTTYFYELEDLESTGVRERHGPVSATPLAGASFDSPDEDEAEEEDGSYSGEHTITYGNPEETRLRVVKRTRRQVTLELITGGFYAEPQEDGSVRLSVPGFLEDWEPGSPAIPVKRTWLQAVVGKQVKLKSVKAKNVEAFSLRPTSAEMLEPVMLPDGTVSLASSAQPPGKAFRGQGLYPETPVHVVSVAFQGDMKKAFLELSPLRWDRSTGQLLLARRLIVKVKFSGKVPGEKSLGRSRGRKRRNKNAGNGNVVANLVTHDPGLYSVSHRALFGNKRRGIKTRKLNLTYQGEPVPFYVHPNKKQFKRGSRLYFLSGGEDQNPYGREAVYVLSLGSGGQKMERASASPSGSPVDHYWKTVTLEENHLFQGRLVTAPDVWLWDFLLAPVTKAYPFNVQGLASTSESGSLKIWLQGTTNLPQNPDHHVRIYLNGLLLEDFTLEGELPWMGEMSLLPGALVEGENTLELENVGDTGAAYSRIMLNRFEVTYPRQLVADSGQLRGSFGEAGTAEVTGFTGNALLLDTTGPVTLWLRGAESFPGGLRFRAEDDHRYLLADSTAVMSPEIRRPFSYRLKTMTYGANYVVIGPESLLEAAWPLLELRIGQGLTVLAVPIEQIYSEFGHGETRPDAIRDFLGYAYHNWRTPPRYVLLLGDGTFDFKDYFGWGVENQVPPFPIKSNYLWTASDPAYAAVNGDDLLPDIAIGRLPAANLEEAQAMVHKIVTYETEGMGLLGKAVLIADRPDPSAGDFEANAEELAATLLSGHDVEKIYLDELGTAATHDTILQTFDEGASLVSYIGHGAMNLWSENILRTDHVDSLDYPAHYPLLLTMNCLNGYFQFPTFDSLSETLLKADGKGIIAAFSPSGESLDAPAHFYHRLLLTELLHGGHATLGDAVLAAQSKFAESGGYLELLSIYHLFGDPAMKLQQTP